MQEIKITRNQDYKIASNKIEEEPWTGANGDNRDILKNSVAPGFSCSKGSVKPDIFISQNLTTTRAFGNCEYLEFPSFCKEGNYRMLSLPKKAKK